MERAGRVMWVVLSGLVIGWGIHLVADWPASTTDWRAFWVAARLAGSEELFSIQAQHDLMVEAGLLSAAARPLVWAYPPPVAVLLAPLAALPYAVGFLLWEALLVAALVAAGRWLFADRLDLRWWLPALFLWIPMFKAVQIGQTTPLVLLLIVVTVGCSLNGRELASGTAAGLLAFKPQAASLVGLWLLVRGRWRAAATAMSVGVGWYLVGATAFGTGWPMRWMIELVGPFLARFQGPASLNSASPVEILRQGVGGPAGWALVVLGLAAGLWWILSVHRRTGAADWTIAGVALATVAVAPHSFLYELGLAAPAIVLVLLDGDRRLRMAAGVVIAGSLTIWTLTPYLGAAVTLAVLALFESAVRRGVAPPGQDPDSVKPVPDAEGLRLGPGILPASNA